MSEDRKAWLAGLKPGDRAGMHDGWRVGTSPMRYVVTVVRRTPTGRINVRPEFSERGGEIELKPDGYRRLPQGSLYADRHIEPLQGNEGKV